MTPSLIIRFIQKFMQNFILFIFIVAWFINKSSTKMT